jgi:thioredoxin-like negative regulator of GroEL
MEIKDIKTKEVFDQELRSSGNKFILFYSAWCPFCVEFTPAFEKLAAGNPAAFCKVSTDDLPEIGDLFSIEVVPTVLFFRGGKLDKRLDGIEDKGLTPERLAEFVWLCRGSVNRG